MEMIDLFLREHAAAHSRAVAPADFNMDWLVDGLSDDDWRARPHRLNSLAWLSGISRGSRMPACRWS